MRSILSKKIINKLTKNILLVNQWLITQILLLVKKLIFQKHSLYHQNDLPQR